MEKINIAELLKDCPRGMELYSPITGECTLVLVDDNVIRVHFYGGEDEVSEVSFYKYGNYFHNGECLLFPSKGKTTWKGFVPPCNLKDGDVAYCKDEIKENQLFIIKAYRGNGKALCYLFLDNDGTLDTDECVYNIDGLATEEEKQKLFDAIKANGYKWNEETKTLEKLVEPIFKVGNKIRHKIHIRQGNVVTEIKDTHYILDDELALPFISQGDYELVPNKFDINTLKPFESKVLVRDEENLAWRPAIFGLYNPQIEEYFPFIVVGGVFYTYCIPYEGNQHLLGTTNDCDDFYKTWEK